MDRKNKTYTQVLIQALERKLQLLISIEKYTNEQAIMIASGNVEPDDFEKIMIEKEKLIEELIQLDKGFDQIYRRVHEELSENKEKFRDEIKEMQRLITEVTNISVSLQALEHQNRDKLEVFFSGKKKEVRAFKVSHQSAANYYKNMSNQHQEGQSYFMNKKR